MLEEKKVVEEFTAKTSGKILKVAGNPGDDVKKGKHAVVVDRKSVV